MDHLMHRAGVMEGGGIEILEAEKACVKRAEKE
jgi:hypothetical protein